MSVARGERSSESRLERHPAAIQRMFAGVARRYDLLNRLLSLRRDVAWRRLLVAAVAGAPAGPILDVATGTGDVALAIRDRLVVGTDFCVDMLAVARRKRAKGLSAAVRWVAGDALRLPFPDGAFGAITVAFGVRNFAALGTGLAEFHRVLRPGGVAAVLEFHRPASRIVRISSGIWNRLVVTPVGRVLSDDPEAYAYLPASVDTFGDAGDLARSLVSAGFSHVASRPFTGGIAVLTVGTRGECE